MGDEQVQNLAHIHWSWPEAIAANPAHSLANADLALDYFAYSPFWDPQSNNNQLRTQRGIENPTYGAAEEKLELLAFRDGFEYIVAHARAPEVFVIHRRPVLGENKRGPPTHAYFILHDRIYQAPNLYDVMQTRLRNATWSLQKTFAMLERARPAANPRATGNWVAVARDGKEKKKDDKDDGKDETKEEGKEEDKDAAGLGDDAPAQAGPAGTNWHLLHALASTQAALTDIDKLAAAPAPAFDEVAEARALEAMATAAIRGPAAAAAAAAAAVAATGAPAPSVAPPVPTRAPSLVPTLATPGAFPGTPAAFAPSPLRRAGLPFGGDSPAPL